MTATSSLSLPLDRVQGSVNPTEHNFIIHKVRPGETLWGIAGAHKVSYENVLRYNLAFNLGIFAGDLPAKLHQQMAQERPLSEVPVAIKPGQKILIPYSPELCPEEVGHATTISAHCTDHSDDVYVYNGATPIAEQIPQGQKALNELLSGLRDDITTLDAAKQEARKLKSHDADVREGILRSESGISEEEVRLRVRLTLIDPVEKKAEEKNCERISTERARYSCLVKRAQLFGEAQQISKRLEALLRTQECNTNKMDDTTTTIRYTEDEVGNCIFEKLD